MHVHELQVYVECAAL